jgi:hypothetical protein
MQRVIKYLQLLLKYTSLKYLQNVFISYNVALKGSQPYTLQ